MESHRSVWLAAFGVIGAAATAFLGTALAFQVADKTHSFGRLLERPEMIAALVLYGICLVIFWGILYEMEWVPRGRLTRNATVAKNLRSANCLLDFERELRGLGPHASDAEIYGAVERISAWFKKEEPDLLDSFLSDVGFADSASTHPAHVVLERRLARLNHLHRVMHNRAEIGG